MRKLIPCLLVLSFGLLTARSAPRPNVVLILADDLGAGDLRSYNSASKIPTPHLDQLAHQSLRFTSAYTPSAVCTPTRYGLLTGRYSWRTKLQRGVLNGYSPLMVDVSEATLPKLLREAGYRTACIGKWHLGLGTAQTADFAKPLQPGPNAVGFDYFYGIPASLDMPPYVYIENDHVIETPSETISDSAHQRNGGKGYWRGGPIAPRFRHDEVLPTLRDKAKAFLQQQKSDQPFFLYLALTAPHTPWLPTAEARGRSGAGDYGDFVAQVDDVIGAVVQTLNEGKLSENTLLIVTSDNGAHWPRADIERWQHHANGPWRGQKADIWEGGQRVPLLLRWPGHIRPGQTAKDLVCLTDVIATLAELLEVRLPENAAVDSFSFAGALLDRPTKSAARDHIIYHAMDGTRGIQQRPWKLALGLGSRGFSEPRQVKPQPGEPEGQLYHLERDPGEEKNVWADEPAVVERLRALLNSSAARGRTRPE